MIILVNIYKEDVRRCFCPPPPEQGLKGLALKIPFFVFNSPLRNNYFGIFVTFYGLTYFHDNVITESLLQCMFRFCVCSQITLLVENAFTKITLVPQALMHGFDVSV